MPSPSPNGTNKPPGTFQDKLRTLHSLCQDIVKLRRSDHHATRLSFEVKRQKDEEEKTDMEILARFKEWASVEEVRDWICKDWVSLEERERELMEFYGYEEPTAASPAPSAESSPAAEPAPDLIPILTDYRNNESGRSVCLSAEPVMDQR
jgi:hypothetical protein